MKSSNIKNCLHLTSKIIFNVVAILFGIVILLATLTSQSAIETLLTDHVFGKPDDTVITTGKEPIRFKTWYSGVEDVLDGNDAVAAAAQAEGTVLLKNDNDALPLAEGAKVSLYGVTAYDPMYSLDGAGEVKVNADRQQYFYSEFEKVGLDMNKSLADWYNGAGASYRRNDYINIYDNTTNTNGKNAILNGAAWNDIPEASKDRTNYGADSTAIFVVGRMTNEGVDLPPYVSEGNSGLTESDYLKFSPQELTILQNLHQNYDKVVLIINQANPVQEDMPALMAQYNVDAVLWIGFPGSAGIAAVADILVGKTTPSGGLSTAWYTGRGENPSSANYSRSTNVVMQEGIYLGYRFAETRYEDVILGSTGAGTYNYGNSVSYPFGYGLSYTSFSYELVGVVPDADPTKNYYTTGSNKGEKRPEDEWRATGSSLGDCDDLVVKVKVTNTGAIYSGKENVQVYLQQPYTETNKKNGVEKPSVELVGFGKTSKLAPGASETLEIKIDANKYFAAYDRLSRDGVGGYVLDAGTYYLAAASNSHEALNSILKAKGQGDLTKLDQEYGAGDPSLVQSIEVSEERAASYRYRTQGSADDVHNLFDQVDLNVVSGEKRITYFSRSNWEGTAAYDTTNGYYGTNYNGVSTSGLNVSYPPNGQGSFTIENIKNVYQYYDYDLKKIDTTEHPSFGVQASEKRLMLADMIGVEYDPARGASEEDIAKWKEFMDQLTWEEVCTVTGSGLRRTVAVESVGKPYTNDVNASNAISWMFDMSLAGGAGTSNVGFANKFDSANRAHNPTGYPCEGIIASSFNIEVAYAVGQAIGEDGLWTGASGLYGFGLGLHRNPYHGRAGEYYSDDPYLTGVMGGYESLGAQSKGMYVYNKHFVLNDQETSRTSYNTWLTEQTMRQIYLRPFEIAIEIGDAMNVMTAFNHIGTTWSSNDYNLTTAWLRGEAGMAGFAVTDYWRSGGMNLTWGILGGVDLPDGNNATDMKNYGPDAEGFGFYTTAVRQSAQRIMYVVANSSAMNFIGDDTVIITHEPTWFGVRDGIATAATVVFLCSVAFLVATTTWNIVDKAKKQVPYNGLWKDDEK